VSREAPHPLGSRGLTPSLSASQLHARVCVCVCVCLRLDKSLQDMPQLKFDYYSAAFGSQKRETWLIQRGQPPVTQCNVM